MTASPAPPRSRTAAIQDELDLAHRSAAMQRIVIPPCPTLLTRLQHELNQREPDLKAVADIASHDVAMAAVLIARGNSPLHAAGQAVTTVGQAMNRLGLDETAQVMQAFLVQRALPVRSAQLQRFWERSRQRAVAMDFIARQLPGVSPDLAHTTGLFCHVGLPVMLQCLKGYAGTLVEADARIDRSAIATENANHRTDHAVIGALVCRAWRLGASVVAAVRLHHDLAALRDDGVEPEVRTLVAAALVAEHLMRRTENLAPDRDWHDHAEAALGWLGIGLDDLQAWDEQLDARLAMA